MAIETKALEQVLTQLRGAAARAGISSGASPTAAAGPKPADFATLLKAC
jgi:hypothetical protein